MAVTVIGLIRFGFSLIFGLMVSVLLAGIESTRKNRLIIGFICVCFLFVQLVSWWFLGIDMTSKLYPLIIHLPIIIILSLYFKCPWHISAISVLTGYLCCQVPRWIGFLAGAAFGSKIADHTFYIAAVFLSYYLLKKYVIGSVRQLMVKSPKSCLLLGGVPFFYYAFDYFTTIYTDVLYSGAEWAVQFMPSIISIFYFVFVILYYIETQKQADFQRERDMLDTQLRQAQREFESLKQLQQNAAAYRHDMRHHLALLQGLAANGLINEINEYLQTAQSGMDAITPIRYCENETVNLILSSFAAKARQAEITLEIDVRLPDLLVFSDTELCSLLSNAMENAIKAAQGIADSSKRIIRLRMYSKNNKLCIDLRNSYHTEPVFHQGLPVSKEQGHGYGTKSMAQIVENHKGIYQFSVKDGWFIFQATI
ncbi:MAG TPA: GHKL domain-containing protein [Bacillota bacterium]|jgi:two-component system sensor histidine kinase AgrC|nr:GHKL domain-containing protein [Bacillota bacterium]HRS20567.1 GHKL domain-containing protein [Clostridia bacterium]HRU40457.1 GHKL domain-containing protein [Candidatus Diapherotrites archaeon]HQE66285.1 GHKL domain-containing protein [Bacillota bacterium]HQJ36528.1 GHKL domain-containing protein [Bacillota bacterium]